jgi:hypothetical protein
MMVGEESLMRPTLLLSNYQFVSALVLLGFFTAVDPSQAAVIYSQTTPSSPTGAYSSTDREFSQKVADNFLVNGPGSATIRSLHFIGGYGVTNPPPSTPPLNALPPDDFRVVFFADSAGAPGAALAGGDFHVGAAIQRTATGGPFLNAVDRPLEYHLDLGTGITVSPSTVNWVSIANNPGTDYFWDWARGPGVLDQRVAATEGNITSGPWAVSTSGGMYFVLSDSNVPEPSTLLLAVGIFAPLAARRRRRG